MVLGNVIDNGGGFWDCCKGVFAGLIVIYMLGFGPLFGYMIVTSYSGFVAGVGWAMIVVWVLGWILLFTVEVR